MSCGSCCKWGKSAMLCPFSLGLAVGLVAFFAVLFWSLWVMQYGVPPAMASHMPSVPSLSESFVRALGALLKGFLFGFFVALFYDLIGCCLKKCCSKSKCDDDTCRTEDKGKK